MKKELLSPKAPTHISVILSLCMTSGISAGRPKGQLSSRCLVMKKPTTALPAHPQPLLRPLW
eukprot:scaffold367520_cov18-Prasinocladus_malaysianus.AAC.1